MKMFETVRARLTWWYTGVLALVLLVFACAAYFFLVAFAPAYRQYCQPHLRLQRGPKKA